MIRPRWRKVLADLWQNPVRSLLVIASMAVGLFAVGMIATTYFLLTEDMRASYRAVNPVNVQVTAAGFDSDFVERIRHLDGVTAAEGVRVLSVRVRTGPDRWETLELKAVDDLPGREVNRLRLEAGEWPQDHELAIDRNKLPDLNVTLGQPLEMELPSGTLRALPVSGRVHDLTIGVSGIGGGYFIAPAQGYVTFDTLGWLEQPEQYNQLLVTVADGEDEAQIQAVANRVLDEFDRNGLTALSSLTRHSDEHPNSPFVDAIAVILFLLGFLVIFLSSFLITNTLSALLNQQVQQIGIMKVLGARRYQVVILYLLLVLVFSALALAISIPLSDRASNALNGFLAERINFRTQGFRTVLNVHLLLALLALIVPQAAGFAPIWRGAGISVQAAISGIHPHAAGEHSGHKPAPARRFASLPRPALISLRNTFRRKTRLILTLITLSLGGAIFISTFNVQSSLNRYVDRLGEYFIADVSLVFQRPYRISEIEQVARRMPEIKHVEGWASPSAQLLLPDGSAGESVHMFAIPPASQLIRPILIAGRWLEPGDTGAITVSDRFLAQLPGLRPGDRVRLNVDGKEREWTVVGIFQMAGKAGGYLVYVNYADISGESSPPNQSAMYRLTAVDGYHTLESQQALSRRLETFLEDQGYQVGEVEAGQALLSKTTRGINTVITFLFIMAVLTALVGSIGLTGTMSMNVIERTREIGILRAVGASDARVFGLILLEGMVIGLLSWLVGSLLAFPISSVLWNGLSSAIFDSTTAFTFSARGFLVWLGVVTLQSLGASLLPARTAVRITIREALAYE